MYFFKIQIPKRCLNHTLLSLLISWEMRKKEGQLVIYLRGLCELFMLERPMIYFLSCNLQGKVIFVIFGTHETVTSFHNFYGGVGYCYL